MKTGKDGEPLEAIGGRFWPISPTGASDDDQDDEDDHVGEASAACRGI
jgi:hypothetical protein